MRKTLLTARFMVLIMILVVPALVVHSQTSTDKPDASLPPRWGSVALTGTDGQGLDPYFVSVLTGSKIDISAWGGNCRGFVDAQPTFKLDWKTGKSQQLRFFTVSDGNPVIAVQTPDGKVTCDTYVNPLVLDAEVTIKNPPDGQYVVWVGSYSPGLVFPAVLVLTESTMNPATFDFKKLVRRDPDPSAAGKEPLPKQTLLVNAPGQYGSVDLKAGSASFTAEFIAGGVIPYFNVQLGNRACTGFGTAQPSVTFTWSGKTENLRVFFESVQNSTLVIATPDGRFLCNAAYQGAQNLNPLIDLSNPQPGSYSVFVGSLDPVLKAPGKLTISEGTSLEPKVLTPAK